MGNYNNRTIPVSHEFNRILLFPFEEKLLCVYEKPEREPKQRLSESISENCWTSDEFETTERWLMDFKLFEVLNYHIFFATKNPKSNNVKIYI